MTQSAFTRQTNYDKRNRRIKEAFELRFSKQAKPRIYTREYILSQLAEEFCLSISTIENILYK